MTPTENRHVATFFLSTGRCGTQWMAEKLSAHYSDLAVARHEPLHAGYEARRYFRAWHAGELPALAPAIAAHVAGIEAVLERSHYIETGWPSFGALPFLLTRLSGRARLVHLHRHPALVAASLTTHRVYRRGEWTDALSISPTDDGVLQPELGGPTWKGMSEFEKCVFWWTELNGLAFRIRSAFPAVPAISLRFDRVFSEDGREQLERLLDLIPLPRRDGFLNSRTDRTDRFRKRSRQDFRIDRLASYPRALAMMEELGYEQDAEMRLSVRRRYRMTLRGRWFRKVRKLLGRKGRTKA